MNDNLITENSSRALVRRGPYGTSINTRALQEGFRQWDSAHGYEYVLHLAFNRTLTPEEARYFLGRFLAKLDRRIIGRNWAMVDTNCRTQMLAFLENPTTNTHYHTLLNLPFRHPYKPPLEYYQGIVSADWRSVVRGGTTELDRMYDRRGEISYVTKMLYRTDALASVVLSSEFWPQ